MGPVEYSNTSQNQTDSVDIKTSKNDIESKIEEVEVELPFRHWSWKRVSAIFSLFVVTGVSQLPLFLISGSLGTPQLSSILLTLSLNCRGHRWSYNLYMGSYG
jgi:hypothetical protein